VTLISARPKSSQLSRLVDEREVLVERWITGRNRFDWVRHWVPVIAVHNRRRSDISPYSTEQVVVIDVGDGETETLTLYGVDIPVLLGTDRASRKETE
jgi:hypothetical protein